jgi:hypothetical protein
MIVFGRFRAPCCFQTWSCLGPFGAARGVVFWRVFWRRSGGRFWSVSSRLWASLFWCASVAARRRAWRPCAAPLRFFVAAWCGGVARCGACGPGRCAAVRRVLCVRARGVPGAAFVFFIVGFFGARCAGVLLLRAPRALRFFFLRARGVPPGRFLVSFFRFIFLFVLCRFYLGAVPLRFCFGGCFSAGVARCLAVFFLCCAKKSLKFFLPAFKQGP